jgi:hypothetical protein
MLNPVQVSLGVLALIIMAGLPLLILVGYDAANGRVDQRRREARIRRFRQPVARHLEHRRNVRALKHPTGTPIERLGADLRRLRGQIQTSDHCSASHQVALRQAYDSVLKDTCAMLQLSHELDRPTLGLERDIERLRVEAMLEARGIVIDRSRRRDQAA